MTWDERIALAEKNGKFSVADGINASQWACCSVGEKMREFHGDSLTGSMIKEYKDVEHIYNLGKDFWRFVVTDKISNAKDTHNKIKKIEVVCV